MPLVLPTAHPKQRSLLPVDWRSRTLQDIAKQAPVQLLDWQLLAERGIEIAVKREDLLDAKISGNKFYKLHGHISHFEASEANVLVTFGGAYSNHIYATAAMGEQLQIRTVGVIRGERPHRLSPTLVDAESMGMDLMFVSRASYRDKDRSPWRRDLARQIGGQVYWVPEGGGDAIGAQGCAFWGMKSVEMAPFRPTHLCVSAGTGGTAAGLLASSPDIPVHAFLAIKGSDVQLQEFSREVVTKATAVRAAQNRRDPLAALHLETEYHCGGYAKSSPELRDFVAQFALETQVPLDPVYTAKLFWGIAQKAKAGAFPRGSKLLAFHTGGLQGRRSMF